MTGSAHREGVEQGRLVDENQLDKKQTLNIDPWHFGAEEESHIPD